MVEEKKLLVSTLYDVATKMYGKIQLSENQEVCERNFHILIESQHLEKYTDKIFLVLLGEYDISSGVISSFEDKIYISYNGSTSKEVGGLNGKQD